MSLLNQCRISQLSETKMSTEWLFDNIFKLFPAILLFISFFMKSLPSGVLGNDQKPCRQPPEEIRGWRNDSLKLFVNHSTGVCYVNSMTVAQENNVRSIFS